MKVIILKVEGYERYVSTDALHNSLCPWPDGGRIPIQVKKNDIYAVEVSPAKVNRTNACGRRPIIGDYFLLKNIQGRRRGRQNVSTQTVMKGS